MISDHLEKHHRRSTRLKDYDYSQAGAYFVTICTYKLQPLFGELIDDQMVLNRFGQIVHEEWIRTAYIRREIKLDVFQVMPNHFHAAVWIVGAHSDAPRAHGGVPLRRAPRSLSSMIANFKSVVTTRINKLLGTAGQPIWQRNYYEHVIRNEDSLNRIR